MCVNKGGCVGCAPNEQRGFNWPLDAAGVATAQVMVGGWEGGVRANRYRVVFFV